MKASEALMIGSMMMKARRGVFYQDIDGRGPEGCALGMIHAGLTGKAENRFGEIYQAFPWIPAHNPHGFELPCGCTGETIMGSGGRPDYRRTIVKRLDLVLVHLFNQHVCDGSWSIEQLADWLNKYDPAAEIVVEIPASDGVGSLDLTVVGV